MTTIQRDMVLYFLRTGEWSQAIAFYQEETGVDMDTASEVVRGVAARHGIHRARSFPWWAWSILAVALSGAVAWYL